MKENKDEPKKVGTCFDGSPCAEMMEKIMGEAGIGSLCEEMMRALGKQNGQSPEEPKEAQRGEGPRRKGSAKIPRRPRRGQESYKKEI